MLEEITGLPILEGNKTVADGRHITVVVSFVGKINPGIIDIRVTDHVAKMSGSTTDP